MDMPLSIMGICITCRYRGSCLPFQNSLGANRPVWDCSEHEHSCADEAGSQARPAVLVGAGGACWDEAGLEGPRGLCVNCDNLATCGASKTSGGVWHCENYS